ncbi:prenyltransferase [bacterium]|nr:prenyltransferase [bacterium]
MSGSSTPGIWMQQIRAPFLILSVALVCIGSAAAFHDGHGHTGHTLLLMLGVVLAHIAVNLFNELSDYRTGIDRRTRRTPFSGGSGMMQAGKTRPGAVRAAAYGSMAVAAAIGVYFCLTSGWLVLLFMIIGGIAVRFYTTHLARMLLGELFAGLALGSLVVLGVYYSIAGTLTRELVFISVPPGILTSLLLFLNEFPDREADLSGGRNHLVIQLGKRKSAVLYAAALAAVYICIGTAPWTAGAPRLILIGLGTLPLAAAAAATSLTKYDDHEAMIPALAMNVGVVILTDLLLAAAYFFA